MKFFFISLCFIFLFSCAEQIDIEATIDERAKKIAHEILNNRLTSTPQPTATPQAIIMPTPQPTATPQAIIMPTPQPTATPQAISSTDTQTLYNEARKKVVRISFTTGNGKSEGSGWIIENGWVITNEHVVNTQRFVTIEFPQENRLEYKRVTGEVKGVDTKRDLAAIKINYSQEPIPTREVNINDIGEQIVTLGYSAGNAGVPSTHSGVITYVKESIDVDTDTLTPFWGQNLKGKISVIVFDADADPGDSGGPLIDSQGNAIGVVYGKLNTTNGKAVTGQQFATNIVSVREVWEDLKKGMNTSNK